MPRPKSLESKTTDASKTKKTRKKRARRGTANGGSHGGATSSPTAEFKIGNFDQSTGEPVSDPSTYNPEIHPPTSTMGRVFSVGIGIISLAFFILILQSGRISSLNRIHRSIIEKEETPVSTAEQNVISPKLPGPVVLKETSKLPGPVVLEDHKLLGPVFRNNQSDHRFIEANPLLLSPPQVPKQKPAVLKNDTSKTTTPVSHKTKKKKKKKKKKAPAPQNS